MKRKIYLTSLAALAAAAIGTAYASPSAENDALAVTEANISLTQAISAAEQHVGGRATHAEYERHQGQGVYEVEVVKNKTVTDVKVDATNGRILAAVGDKADRNHDDEHDD